MTNVSSYDPISLGELIVEFDEVLTVEQCKELIRVELAKRGPDPLTEDWRVVEEFPRYLINRCGEVMNSETGHILKTSMKDDYGKTDSDRSKHERQNITVNYIVHGRSTGSLLRKAFKDIE